MLLLLVCHVKQSSVSSCPQRLKMDSETLSSFFSCGIRLCSCLLVFTPCVLVSPLHAHAPDIGRCRIFIFCSLLFSSCSFSVAFRQAEVLMERWRARSVPVHEHFESLEPVLALRYAPDSRSTSGYGSSTDVSGGGSLRVFFFVVVGGGSCGRAEARLTGGNVFSMMFCFYAMAFDSCFRCMPRCPCSIH